MLFRSGLDLRLRRRAETMCADRQGLLQLSLTENHNRLDSRLADQTTLEKRLRCDHLADLKLCLEIREIDLGPETLEDIGETALRKPDKATGGRLEQAKELYLRLRAASDNALPDIGTR